MIQNDEKQFPIQSERGAKPHPLLIPWSVAERAYSVYSERHGFSQSLERLAERGGFGPSEMDEYVPGWREETSEITRLQGEVENIKADMLSAAVEVAKARTATERATAQLAKTEATLKVIRERIDALERITPSKLSGDEQWNLNGEYVSLFDVHQILDPPALLPSAAVAPEKDGK